MIIESAFFYLFITVIGMLAIWNNFIWIGRDGYNLPHEEKPGFFRFWFIITPRYLLGLKTGMEDKTL